MFESFRPEPYSDFSDPAALDGLPGRRSQQSKRASAVHRPLIIGGERVDTAKRIESINPSRPDQVLGTVAAAGAAEAEMAIAAAWDAFPAWAALPRRGRGPGTASSWLR